MRPSFFLFVLLLTACAPACTEQALNAQETAYFQALSRVASFAASDDRLVLKDAAGGTLLTFVRSR